MEQILVIGANGQVGRRLLKYLSQQEKRVVAMIRSDSQAKEITELGGTPIVMDIENDFSEACKDIDCVIFTAGSGSSTGADKTIAIDQEGAIRAIDFARAFGVKLFVMVSAQGARSPENDSPIQHYFKAKSLADEYLLSSGLDYTIYRPGRLSNEPGQGKIQIADYFDFKGITKRDDLAQTISRGIDSAKTKNRIIEIFDGAIEIESALSNL